MVFKAGSSPSLLALYISSLFSNTKKLYIDEIAALDTWCLHFNADRNMPTLTPKQNITHKFSGTPKDTLVFEACAHQT